ncbi:Hpt domain-containing protein [Duganella sp. Root198D2]|uniref:hybrid sensor histidine kinase/response regulator n=1 Tax=Duganella sp. Root198D2 TaxID=1736489 RepID=UPI00070B8DAE|nr:Hpt domain-containing protein [Duganella sp. Root198D2]KRB83662.1 chemotaxis protein [Duganella sp. Root198D2]
MSKPDLSFTALPQYDTGPLSWVMGEIREALARSRTALFEAGGRDAEDQTTALMHAKSHLHQAHGALQMVDVDGVALLTQLAEVVLDRMRDGTLKCTADHAQLLANMYQALVEFLEELLSGAPFQPVRLFPFFRDIQDLLGIDRVHPADLFFPDVSYVPELPAALPSTGAPTGTPDYKALRQRFERALLPYLKAADAGTQAIHAAALQAAITDVADQQGEHKARVFWRAMQAFAELVVNGQQESNRYVKQLFGLINLQLRRLSAGSPELPDNVLKEALFFVASADPEHLPPLARQLRAGYALDGMVPHDFETRRYGRIDDASLAAAREGIAHARSVWQRIEQNENSAELDNDFGQSLAKVAVASEMLGLGALAALLRQLAESARNTLGTRRSEALGLEMATALLFAEHGIAQIRHLPDDFNAHADTIAARLQALAAGGTAPEPAQWQGGLARQLHEEDTVVALALEMKTGLRQVEKMLDEYYTDPARRGELSDLDKVLHQLHGACAILDQDDAMNAAAHVRIEIGRLASGQFDQAHEAKALDDIAQNVGALGFFVDMLAQNPSGARERFAFDPEHGTFRAVPFKKISGPESIPVLEEALPEPEAAPEPVLTAPVPEAGAAGDEAVEAELLEIFIGEAQEVLAFVRETLARPHSEISNLDTMTMLRRSFHTLKGSSRMVGLNRFGDGGHAIEKVMNLWLAEERRPSEDLFALLNYASEEMSAWVEELATTGNSARQEKPIVDAATRLQDTGVFERPAAGTEAVAAPEADAGAAIEAIEVAEEAAAPLEAEAAPAEPVEALSADPVFDLEAIEVSEPEAELTLEEPLVFEAQEEAAPARSTNVIEFPTATAPTPPEPPAEDNMKFVGRLAIPLPLYNIYMAETDELVRLLSQDFGEWRHEQRAVNPEALHAVHTLTGTSGTVGFKPLRELSYALEITLQELQPPAPHLDDAQHDLFDFTIERVRQMLQSFATGELPPEQPELIEALHKLREHLAHPPEVDKELDEQLDSIVGEPEGVQLEQRLDNLFSDTYHSLVTEAPAAAESVEQPAPEVLAQGGNIDNLFDSAFDDAFDAPELKQAAPVVEEITAPVVEEIAEPVVEEITAPIVEEIAEPVVEEITAPVVEEIAEPVVEESTAPIVEEIAAPVVEEITEPVAEEIVAPVAEEIAAPAIEEAAPAIEEIDEAALLAEADAAVAEAAIEVDAIDATALAAGEAIEEDAVDLDHAAPSEVQVVELPETPHLLGASPSDIHDELDPDLLPVFLEEGTDLLPQIGESLRAWHAKPTDFSHAHSLQRVLHTVKGSARMAGAMRLGQHAHEIETHIENMVHAGSASQHSFDELMAHYDHALLLFEQLQNPEAYAAAMAAAQAAAAAPAGEAGAPASQGAAQPSLSALAARLAAAPATARAGDEAEGGAKASPLVRVRADILDRLVNQAGEVSITRSRLENEVTSLRTSVSDFQENLNRLRRQLREVEMQAESQIASRMSIAGEREFDPLEFDRFTRLQELTRMMAESVSDVASFHEGLIRSIDGATGDLTQQARMTRDLQRDLMRVRMVPFNSVSERLFRVARQGAKETDKRVNLDIRGGGVEMDRSVLERMAAPFEHLLRNAIVHGIESRERRVEHGKGETGELLVQVSQQGNEVVLEFSDDGAGLDLERIRNKARSVGLLAEDQVVSDAEASNLIFQPGFSTADTLTELAGRGVGMDIVLSEAQALGGRVETFTEAGKGSRFTIRLPLTLAVTQVVLISAGGRTHAVPALMVEQVLQLKEGALAEATGKGAVVHHGQHVPLRYLATLLGDGDARPLLQRSSPVMMLRNGTDRVALHVDEILGNREVVIKNIGPQLSRMPGIAGATVLGSGEIVLILNPVALQLHVAQHPELAPRTSATPAPAPAGGVAEPVQQTRAHGTVMVVDDSLTVRKVTQRLLEREGYHVMLAKDGVDALEQLQDRLPELMLVDIEMPRMDGFDLTRNVRGDERTKEIPIIMITSRSADKHRNYALQLGVNAYFGKPFQEDILLGAIAGLLPQRA